MRHLSLSNAFATMIGLSLVAALGGGVGCSFITNTTAIQCRSDNECAALGPEFYGYTCDLSTHTCGKVAEDSDLCVATPTKSANLSCIEKFGGDPAICSPKSHKCVRLQTPECPEVIERSELGFLQGGASDLQNDNTVILGLVDGRNCCYGLGDPLHYFAELAFQQVVQLNSQGLPTTPTGAPRPIAVLVCPEAQPDRLTALGRAAKHLANEVEVPLVIGPYYLDDINIMYDQGLRDKRIPLVLPTGGSRQDLQALPNPAAPTPLIYDINPSAAEFIEMYAQLVKTQLEPRIRATPGFSGNLRVALITEKALSMREPEALWEQKITFNGKTTAQNLADKNFLKVSFPDTSDTLQNPNPQAAVDEAVKAIVNFDPHIVIHNVPETGIPLELFQMILAMAGAPIKAYHIDVNGNIAGFPDTLRLANSVGYPHQRFLTWAPHRSPEDVARGNAVAQEIAVQYNKDPNVRTKLPFVPYNQALYDTMFFASYLISAVGDKPLTAENFVAAVPRLTAKGADAQRINTGLTDGPRGFEAMKNGRSIDLVGITSTMDVDPATGAAKYDQIETICFKADGTPYPSGFYSDPTAGSIGDITSCD